MAQGRERQPPYSDIIRPLQGSRRSEVRLPGLNTLRTLY